MLEMEFNNMLTVATERRVESDLPKSWYYTTRHPHT